MRRPLRFPAMHRRRHHFRDQQPRADGFVVAGLLTVIGLSVAAFAVAGSMPGEDAQARAFTLVGGSFGTDPTRTGAIVPEGAAHGEAVPSPAPRQEPR